jgi:hypothetical protein
MVHRICECGQDGTGLGRWTWQVFRGKDGKKLRVVTAYRPVYSESTDGTTWSQQKAYFDKNNIAGDPREVFTKDLQRAVQGWVDAGEQVVLGIDANEDVRSGQFVSKMREAGLKEIVTGKHGRNGPPTFHLGRVPIDGLFVTAGLGNCRCGYVDTGEEHMAVWLQFSEEEVFGSMANPSNIRARRLQLHDPRVVQRYWDYYANWADEFGYDDRVMALYEKMQANWTPELADEWNFLDRERHKAMTAAENRCRKLKIGNVQWTPEYGRLRIVLKFWVLIKRRHEGRRHKARFIKRVAKRAGLEGRETATLEEATQQIIQVRQRFRDYKENHVAKREKWLEGLAAAQLEMNLEEDRNNEKLQKRISLLQQRENIRRCHRVIKWSLQGEDLRQAISMVVARNPDGTHRECHTREEIEGALLDENQSRFNQGADSPFLQEPLAEAVGPTGNGPMVEQILQGTFEIPESVDKYTANLIRQMKRPEQFAEMKFGFNPAIHVRGWRRARERTSAGPSGLHFGHFMALARSEHGEIEAMMAQMPYEFGFAPQRWTWGTEVMILKQLGNFCTWKLRAILLYEADFNFNNKRLGREMMYFAEAKGWIAKEQYGSRKNLSAIEHCLNKMLSFDLIRQLKRTAVLCSNDAKGCYDRIVHSVAAICMRRLGAPQEPIESMFRTIQNLRHTVRTAHGDSESFFNAKDVHPVAIQGVGQGNGAGPQIWAAISTVLLNQARATGCGGSFQHALTGDVTEIVGYSFVDDTDLLSTGTNSESTATETVEKMQTLLDEWEGGLRATGGAIEPAKTFWYLIDFERGPGGWKYSDRARTEQLEVRNSDGTRVQLERVQCSEARRTLGVRLAPDGNMQAQYGAMMEQIEKWAEGTRTRKIPRHMAWTAFTTHLWPKLSYALPATTLTKAQGSQMDSTIAATLLPAMGINRHLPKALVHGSRERGGLGIPRVYTTQGAEAVSRVVRFGLGEQHLNGELLQASLQQAQLEIGMTEPLLTLPYSSYSRLMTPCYWKMVWEFTHEAQVEVRHPDPKIPLLREGDCLLMDRFREYVDGGVLMGLNRCRKWLKAVFGNGVYLTEAAWLGRTQRGRSEFSWSKMHRPNEQDWDWWRKWLTQVFTTGELPADPRWLMSQPRFRKLRTPLARWTAGTTHQWMYHRGYNRVYCTEPTLMEFTQIPGRARRGASGCYGNPTPCEEVPSGACPATVEWARSLVKLTGFADFIQEESTTPRTLGDRIERLPIEWQSLLEGAQWPEEGRLVAEAISSRQAVAVSDGTVREGRGAASAVIEGLSSQAGIHLNATVPGNSASQASFRSEAVGLLMIVAAVTVICEHHGIQNGEVKIACDGKSALDACFSKSSKIDPGAAHFDVITAVRNLVRLCPIKFDPIHVKGHQETRPLDRLGALNEDMDKACKEWWAQAVTPKSEVFPTESWSVWLQGRKVNSDLKGEIANHVGISQAERYWDKRSGVGHAERVDWQAHTKAGKEVQGSRRIWIVKQASGMFASGKMMVQVGDRDRPDCPFCGQPENSAHIWLCQHQATLARWSESIQQLGHWMQTVRTDPAIMAAVLEHLAGWRSESTPNPGMLRVTNALASQNVIGWRGFLEGRVSTEWGVLQQEHYRSKGSRKSGKRWTVELIKKLWGVAWDMWLFRNDQLHKRATDIVNEQRLTRIQELHNTLSTQQYPSIARQLNRPLDEILAATNQAQVDWLARVEGAKIKHDREREQETPMDRMRRNMRDFLSQGQTT